MPPLLLTFPQQHPERPATIAWEVVINPLKHHLKAHSDPNEFKCDSPIEIYLHFIVIEFQIHTANQTNLHRISLGELDSVDNPTWNVEVLEACLLRVHLVGMEPGGGAWGAFLGSSRVGAGLCWLTLFFS